MCSGWMLKQEIQVAFLFKSQTCIFTCMWDIGAMLLILKLMGGIFEMDETIWSLLAMHL